jgi:hypothetical protein
MHPSRALSNRVFPGPLGSDLTLDDLAGPCVVYGGSLVGVLIPMSGVSGTLYCLGLSPLGFAVATSGGYMPPAVIPFTSAFLILGGTQNGTPDASLSIGMAVLKSKAHDGEPDGSLRQCVKR